MNTIPNGINDRMKGKPQHQVLFWLRTLFVISILFFLGRFVYVNLSSLRQHAFTFKPTLAIISVILIAIYLLLQAILWQSVLRRFKIDAPGLSILGAFFLALFGKYIPGKVWVAAFRVTGLREEMNKKVDIVSSIFLEHLYLLTSGSLFYILVWGAFIPNDAKIKLSFLILFIVSAGFIIFYPKWAILLCNRILERMGHRPIRVNLTPGASALYFLLYSGTWIFLSLAIWLMSYSFVTLEIFQVFRIGSAFALSFVAGFLALFAPGGIGIREGLFVVLTTTILPHFTAVIIAIALRLAFTAAEILGISCISIVNVITKRTIERSPEIQ